MNEFLRENLAFLEASIPENVHLHVALAQASQEIVADPVQMHQLIVNLVLNAVQAIGDRPGEITLAGGSEIVSAGDERYWLYTGEPLAPGRYVTIIVEDNGGGMGAKTRQKIFDSFFTTKEKGTGLGLAVVLGIVRGHQGGIGVHSVAGEGARFKLLLPVLAESGVRRDAQITRTKSASLSKNGVKGSGRFYLTLFIFMACILTYS